MRRNGIYWLRRDGRGVCRLAVAVMAGCLALSGCGRASDDFEDAVIGSNGRHIPQDQINRIRDDTDLTEEEKRQALRDLGITDEDLIDVLLHGA